jgi:TolB-like protein
MSGSPASNAEDSRDAALSLLADLDKVELDRFAIVGNYLRFDDRTRHSLKDFRQKITGAYDSQSVDPRNFLIWGAPGSGKSYLVQQVAEGLRERVQYRELNLAQLDKVALQEGLEAINVLSQPALCLIDEVDSQPNESWPYEILLPYLEPSVPRSHRVCFCLAGSGGRSLGDMKERMRARPKGPDLLSRIPVGNEYVVPSLGIGDKVLVSAVQLLSSAAGEGLTIREIEKLALYYIAVEPSFASARQLRSLASQCAQRIPRGEDRVKYDHLFHPGDPENKGFWLKAEAARQRLAGAYLPVEGGPQLIAPPRRPSESPTTPRGNETPNLEPSRLVVLPFANISPDPADEYFADGMTEELIERLAHVPGLRIIARTTAMHYKGSKQTALAIGRELRTGTVVECSVRKAGNRLRITAQLIDTRSEEHLWSTRYDRDLDDIFAIQDDISGQITAAISARLSAGAPKPALPVARVQPDTKDVTAYTQFLHGVKLLGEKGSEATIREAVELFEHAIERDPEFARARVMLAEALLYLGTEGAFPFQEATERAQKELARALAQDDTLAEAHSVLAGLMLGTDDISGALREARRASELNPSLSDPYRWMAQVAAGQGRIDESVRLLEEAQALNPVDVNIVAFLGRAYLYAGRDADALAHWERTKSLVAFRTNAHLAEYYFGRDELSKAEVAVREMERMRPQSVWTETYRAMLSARQGNPDEARHAIDRLTKRGETGEFTTFFVGFIHFALGEMDAFVSCMEESFRQHNLPLLELQYSRLFESARRDPRILSLIARQIELGKTPR